MPHSETISKAPQSAAPSDPYPSRCAPEPGIVTRADPVLWGGPRSSGPLSAEQLGRFEADGYLVLERFLDTAAVERLRCAADAAKTDPHVRPVTRIRETGDDVVRSVFAIAEQSPAIGALAGDRRIVDMARQILADDVYIHQSRINYKPGFDGREFFWHSDFETWHVEDGMPRMRAVSMSFMLDDNIAANGPLMLIRGSHRYYVQCVGETPRNHYEQSLRKQEYGVPDPGSLRSLADQGGIVSVLAPAGSVVIFDCNTLHGSAGNISPYPRSNIFLVYNGRENRCGPPFCGMPPRPEHVAHRHASAAL